MDEEPLKYLAFTKMPALRMSSSKSRILVNVSLKMTSGGGGGTNDRSGSEMVSSIVEHTMKVVPSKPILSDIQKGHIDNETLAEKMEALAIFRRQEAHCFNNLLQVVHTSLQIYGVPCKA